MFYLHADMNDATKYGVDEAIFINILRGWIMKNQAAEVNLKEGKTWAYYSYPAWARLLPCYSEKQIRRIIQSLKKQNIIEVKSETMEDGNHINWYSFSDEKFCPNLEGGVPKRAGGGDQTGTPHYIYKNKEIKKNPPIPPLKRGEDFVKKIPRKKVRKLDTAPCEKIVALFSEILPDIPLRKNFTPTRKRLINARWHEMLDETGNEKSALSLIKQTFKLIAMSDFLMGKTEDKKGRSFALTFNWVFHPSHWDDILSLKYNHDMRKNGDV